VGGRDAAEQGSNCEEIECDEFHMIYCVFSGFLW
jgi:hypothetical protein